MRTITFENNANYVDGKIKTLKMERMISEDYEEFYMEQEEETKEFLSGLKRKFFRFPEEW